jgi:hypothetical protein
MRLFPGFAGVCKTQPAADDRLAGTSSATQQVATKIARFMVFNLSIVFGPTDLSMEQLGSGVFASSDNLARVRIGTGDHGARPHQRNSHAPVVLRNNDNRQRRRAPAMTMASTRMKSVRVSGPFD